MAREDFITDNLVDIREKLRRNYQTAGDAAVPGEGSGASAGSSSHPVSAVRSDAARERRDFEGRIRRDGAKVRALLAEMERRRAGLTEFDRFLTRSEETLNGIAAGDPQGGVPEALRIEYWQQLGAFEALSADAASSSAGSAEVAPCRREWMIPGAIVFAALLLAVVLVILFA